MFRFATALRTARKSFVSALTAQATDAIETPAEAALEIQPTTPEIVAAITEFEADRVTKNAADCRMRKTRKIIDAIADGIYGPWAVRRVPSSRKNPDMDAIRKFYALHNAEVPMISQADTLKIVAVADETSNVVQLARAA